METSEKVIDILNDLVRINNDRIEGYERAADEIKDTQNVEVKSLFFKMAEDSRSYKNDLTDVILSLGGEPAQDTTASGKIYRAWMDVKATFSGSDLKAALEACEFGEDAALKAYQDALQSDVAWPAEVSALISQQRQEIRSSHDRVKRYRDEHRAIEDVK